MSGNDIAKTSDDGLAFDDVGSWAEEKHALVSLYASLFSTAMKGKWGKLTYVELYAGSGRSRIRGTSRFITGSPLNALTAENPFDKYIFCEKDVGKLDALKSRVQRVSAGADVTYIGGDCNKVVGDILAKIPAGSKSETALSLCFVDPYGIGIKFETLRALSSRFIDFLVLLAVYMDANRNYELYVSEDATKVDEFLGSQNWRERWNVAKWNAVPFPEFLATEFASSMESLDYLPTPLHRMKRMKSDEKNLPLYYLALFSRNDRGHKFWDQVLKYGTGQKTLFEG